eukprot:TRINITY_DN9322_c0_g6_i1.p1 TRINITY_DN9322_c0_g6~~TRINITY_DN9322_c0_g6_i1.p1  ORF type:complete len:505 (+),score=91.92 TRINITY_DN9322_c0_g6_i1:114-1628(+)
MAQHILKPLMEVPNQSLVTLIKKCTSLRHLKLIQAHMVRTGLIQDTFLASKLIESSALSPHINYSHLIFSHTHHPNTFMWNTLIRGYSLSNSPSLSLSLFQQMHSLAIPPNSFTFAFLLKSCSLLQRITEGKQIHTQITKLGLDCEVPVANGLVRLYMCCAHVENARQLFDAMTERDGISWSVVVSGYAQNGCAREALDLFGEMRCAEIEVDGFTLATVVGVCGDLGALDLGKWVHSYIDRKGVEMDVVLGSSLVDMYAKCGSLDEALGVFELMEEKDVLAWSTMIAGYAIHGCGEKALKVFAQMKRANMRPNCVTFTSVLCACSHSGLVDVGRHHFNSMRSDYGIEPQIEHYGCMVDLFCRAGLINEAHEFIEGMPIEPNVVLWRTLLGACKLHGYKELGEEIGRKIIEIDPGGGENYVLVSNVYASLGRWSSVSKVRNLMKDNRVKRRRGWSSIEVNFTLHEFVMGDESHPKSEEIYKIVDQMAKALKQEGYVATTRDLLHD